MQLIPLYPIPPRGKGVCTIGFAHAIHFIDSIDFLQSEPCNDNKSLPRKGTRLSLDNKSINSIDNKSIDFYAKQIRRSFATDKDKSSLQSWSINLAKRVDAQNP